MSDASPMSPQDAERFRAGRDYIALQETIPLESFADQFEVSLRRFRKVVPVGEGTRIFEVGVGGGWFLIHAARQGIDCRGIEINPELAEFARERAERAGVAIDVTVGTIEDAEVVPESCDVVVANSVLEHVPDYERALNNMYQALRPGGLLYFNSTNKFALRSGEYPNLRLYGWLPYRLRRGIRVRAQGPEIVASAGIDFHQFTYSGLRRTLRRVGFSRVIDIFDFLDTEDLSDSSRQRVMAMRLYKTVPGVKPLLTTFANGTDFYCVK